MQQQMQQQQQEPTYDVPRNAMMNPHAQQQMQHQLMGSQMMNAQMMGSQQHLNDPR